MYVHVPYLKLTRIIYVPLINNKEYVHIKRHPEKIENEFLFFLFRHHHGDGVFHARKQEYHMDQQTKIKKKMLEIIF